jgi:hypothetical protein
MTFSLTEAPGFLSVSRLTDQHGSEKVTSKVVLDVENFLEDYHFTLDSYIEGHDNRVLAAKNVKLNFKDF